VTGGLLIERAHAPTGSVVRNRTVSGVALESLFSDTGHEFRGAEDRCVRLGHEQAPRGIGLRTDR
jgi:hypothetical protein